MNISQSGSNSTDLFVYISWKTHEGRPVLADDQIRQAAHLAVTNCARMQLCHVLAISSTCNQMQGVFRFPASLAVSHIGNTAMQAANEAVIQMMDMVYAQHLDVRLLWEKRFTSHTLCAGEAADAQAYLQRQLCGTENDRCD